MSSLLIKNGLIVTMDEKRRIVEKGAIMIENDLIIDVGDTSELLKKYNADVVIDAAKKVVLPGLINTHSHLYHTLLKGLGDKLKLIDWLKALVFSTMGHFNKKTAYYSSLLGCLELIKSGITCVVDNGLLWSDTELRDSFMKSFSDVGIRVIEAGMAIDADLFGIVPSEILYDSKIAEKRTVDTIARWHGKDEGRIRVWLGVGTIFNISEDFLMRARDLADKYEVGICIHLQESKDEIVEWKKRFNTTPIKYLHEKIDFLAPNVLVAHCVWINEEDINILKATKAKVSHNPISNMYLASGIAPVPKLLRSGVTVGLGDDGATCSGTPDMFELMKTTVLLQKVASKDPTIITAEKALEMATIDGAKAVGLEKEIGSIEPGKKADLILIDTKKPNLYPLNRVPSQLVYCAKAENVEMVVINGKIVMRNRSITTVNELEVLDEAQIVADELIDASNLLQLKKSVWQSQPSEN